MMIFHSRSLEAAEYYVEPEIGSRLILDDNIRLAIDDSAMVVGSSVETRARIGLQTDRSFLRLVPSIEVDRYSRDVGLAGENLRLNANAGTDLSAKTRLRLDLGLSDEAIGVQEIDVIGAGGFDQIRKTAISATPSVSYAWSERLNLQLSYAYQQVDYEESTAANLNSFTYRQATAGASYNVNETNQVSVTLRQSDYRVPVLGFETENRELLLSLGHSYSPTLYFNAGFGLIDSDTQSTVQTFFGPQTINTSSTGNLYDFSIGKSFETAELNVAFNRSVTPGVIGDQDVRDNYTANWDQKINEQLSANLRFNYFTNESQTNLVQNNNFDSLLLSMTLTYRLTPQLSLAGTYRYRSVDRQELDVVPTSNSLLFQLNYDFDRIAWSR